MPQIVAGFTWSPWLLALLGVLSPGLVPRTTRDGPSSGQDNCSPHHQPLKKLRLKLPPHSSQRCFSVSVSLMSWLTSKPSFFLSFSVNILESEFKGVKFLSGSCSLLSKLSWADYTLPGLLWPYLNTLIFGSTQGFFMWSLVSKSRNSMNNCVFDLVYICCGHNSVERIPKFDQLRISGLYRFWSPSKL